MDDELMIVKAKKGGLCKTPLLHHRYKGLDLP